MIRLDTATARLLGSASGHVGVYPIYPDDHDSYIFYGTFGIYIRETSSSTLHCILRYGRSTGPRSQVSSFKTHGLVQKVVTLLVLQIGLFFGSLFRHRATRTDAVEIPTPYITRADAQKVADKYWGTTEARTKYAPNTSAIIRSWSKNKSDHFGHRACERSWGSEARRNLSPFNWSRKLLQCSGEYLQSSRTEGIRVGKRPKGESR